MEEVHYLLAKFPKTVINLTRVGPWEAGSSVKNIGHYIIIHFS